MDYSWKNPTPEQLESLQSVCKSLGLKVPDTNIAMLDISFRHMLTNMNEYKDVPQIVPPSIFELAEMRLTSKDSLWYVQAKGDSKKVAGARLLVEAVDSNYDLNRWGEKKSTNVIISSCYCYAKYMTEGVSQWFRYVPVFLGLNISKIRGSSQKCLSAAIIEETLRVYDKKALKKIRDDQKNSYAAEKCVYPGCDKMLSPYKVAPRDGDFKPYGNSGACSREHAHYECTHTKCIAQAQKNGWKRMTHSFHTKIGTEHLGFIKNV